MDGVPCGLVSLAAQAIQAAAYTIQYSDNPASTAKALGVLADVAKELQRLADKADTTQPR